MTEYFRQIVCPKDDKYAAIIEDNGRVAYAYLLHDKEIVGDVWLYNQASTPDLVDWSDPSNMPFLNPYNFLVKNKEIKPIVSDSDVTIEWSFGDEEVRIQVFIRGELFAVLEKGSLPGWSTLVIKDGPLAKKR